MTKNSYRDTTTKEVMELLLLPQVNLKIISVFQDMDKNHVNMKQLFCDDILNLIKYTKKITKCRYNQ